MNMRITLSSLYLAARCQRLVEPRIPASRTTGVEWGQAVGGISERMFRKTLGHVGGVETTR